MFTPIDADIPSSGGRSPYRSTLDAVRADLGVALDHEAATLAHVQPLTLVDVRRTGRAVFGGTLLGAAAAMVFAMGIGGRRMGGVPTTILALAFPVAFLLAGVSRWWSRASWQRRWRRAEQRIAIERRDGSLDPFVCLDERLGRPSLADHLFARLDHTETVGTRLQLLGTCLVAPLASHLLVYLLLGLSKPSFRLRDFDDWIFFSAIIVGVAHLALLIYVGWFTRRLTTCSREEEAPSHFRPVLVATLGALVPGAPFVVPVVLVALTAVALLPWLFGMAARSFFEDRAALVAIRGALPTPPARLQALGARLPRR